MDLQQFIKESLVQIARGIEEAEKSLADARSTSVINPRYVTRSGQTESSVYGYQLSPGERDPEVHRAAVQRVEFDVAVHTVESKGAHGGAGISVAGITIGAGGKADCGQQSESRIKFMVPAIIPFSRRSVD